MIDGQKSSNEQFDNSSDELEELTGLAVKSGALGSKSSGAGWGGCCVSLVHKDNLDKLLDEMKSYYSKERPKDKQLDVKEGLEKSLFETIPGQGACILDLSNQEWMTEI
jgi:galactokinase